MAVPPHKSRFQPPPVGPHRASHFENFLMATKAEYFCSHMSSSNSKGYGPEKFKRDNIAIDIDSRRPGLSEDEDRSRLCLSKDSIPALFLTETSIHGVKYIAQEERHWSERLFWIIAFVLGVLSSVYLIYGLWDRYDKTPVVVTFDVKDVNTNSIPFPAVTICNLNLFSKQMVTKLTKRLEESDRSSPEYRDASHKLEIIRGLCHAQKTFFKESGLAYDEDEQLNLANHSHDERIKDVDILDFLTEVPCRNLTRRCKFGGENGTCSTLFKPILTDYGKCCTFNMLPLPLLLKHPKNPGKSGGSMYDNPMLGSTAKKHWNESDLELWGKWEFGEDHIEIPSGVERPYRQKRAGRRYGLSIRLDLNRSDLYCPVADSEGLQFTLHSPLEMPHVKEYSSAVHMGKEIFVEVNADVTKADQDIRMFSQEKRGCYFENERQLNFYGPYTRGNCIDECTAREIVKQCSCAAFHLPNYQMDSEHIHFCFNSAEQECVDKAIVEVQNAVDEKCRNCDPLCEEIKYSHQTTIANLKPVNRLIKRHNNNYTEWNRNRSLALLHIFFGSERTVPKLRKALYGIEDLIASTGGILGLCLGFSVLSLIELIYFFTFRPFRKHCKQRKSTERKRISGSQEEFRRPNKRLAWDGPRVIY